jgi:hypothetical protein
MGSGFAQNISIGAGVNYGGAIPTEAIDSTSGKPIIGFSGGVSYSIPLSERFSFLPQLYYSFRGLDYSQSFTRDTLFTVVINGNSGEVPSFYTAYIDGSMRLHYIDIPLLVTYRILKFKLMFGPYISVLLGGRDSGNVRVVIGTGGFFDDYTEAYSNYAVIRKFEQGIMIGSTAPIYKNLSIEIKASRSFTTLYNLDKIVDKGQGSVRMYNTYVQLGLIYTLKSD